MPDGDERPAPPPPSQRTFCALLASVMSLLLGPIVMSTVGCGWYTLTTHDWVVQGAASAGPYGPPTAHRVPQWVGPGHHLVTAAFDGAHGRSWGDSLLPAWSEVAPPYLWLAVGVQAPARDVEAFRPGRVQLIDPSGARDVPWRHSHMSSSMPDGAGWIALRSFRPPYDWQAWALVDSVQLPAREPLELVMEYELRAVGGEVSAYRFAAPCRHSATTTTTFRTSRQFR